MRSTSRQGPLGQPNIASALVRGGWPSSPPMREVPIRENAIRLGQLLKLAGLVDSGAQAKELLADGAVSVNGVREERRGRQLRRGDVVALGGEQLRVV
jgi:ribosome-associated protein